MTDVKSSLARLTAEEKRELAKRLMRERAAATPLQVVAAGADGDAAANGALPAAFYDFDQSPVYLTLLARQAAVAFNPYFRLHDALASETTVIDGRRYVNYAAYNYLGLSGHPDVAAAVGAAVERYGTSVSSSRMVGGERPLHRDLEGAIAAALEVEDCLTMVGGHATNVTTIAHLFGPKDLILHDALSHNSIIVGAVASGARRIAFRHNDWQSVDDLLTRHRRDYERVLIAVEGIYSMDGDFPDLPRFVEIRNRHKAFLMVDEAHSFGVMGQRGLGIREHFGLAGSDVDIWMGTLSKSLASCGGYIAGKASLVAMLRYGAPGFVFSVGLPPPQAAAALAALTIMRAEPERVASLHRNGRLFLDLAQAAGLPTGLSHGISVVPLIVGDTERSFGLTKLLLDGGIHVQPIVHPAVDERSSRLRFFITATHTETQIRETVVAVARLWQTSRA
jgi:7-keto-8-aminopelargonate synthetase-like enzyme